MPQPSQEEIKRIAEDFYLKWQFPNCMGSVDGKHFRIKKPPLSVSDYYNYKRYFSLVLQAVSDADYKFIAIEVGGKGRQSDGAPQNLPGSNVKLPYVLVGDEAYPLKTYLMRPYPSTNLNTEKRIFNKRLSRARVTIENAFGILSNKWRTNTKHAKLIIKVACLLHNIVRSRDGNSDRDFNEYMMNDNPPQVSAIATSSSANGVSVKSENFKLPRVVIKSFTAMIDKYSSDADEE
ncbi:uncharacterized protein LOC134654469 [Cydia amplana]|uniref:uncharacterized protein LOC134654469 n=1 Tax=Cydia amplana TaxID=1869771 RepID=UPI002FE56E42